MKKRWVSAVIALIMFFAVPVYATGPATVFCNVHVEQNRQTVELEVAIAGNPGVASWLMELTWDQSIAEYDSIEYGPAFSNGIFVKNSKIPGKLTVMWYSASDVSDNGTMFKVKLKTDAASEKISTVSLAYSPEDTVNERGEQVSLSVVGSVTIPASKSGSNESMATRSSTADTTPTNHITEHAEGAEGQSPASPADATPIGNTSEQNQTSSMDDKPKVFADVKESDYFYEAVNWAVKEKITSGVSESEFNPSGSCTRAQAVTFLWRAAGSPEPNIIADLFTDVDRGQYYYPAVMWAVENDITLGTGESTFSPDATVTRGQLVTFLWRSAGKETSGNGSEFQDVGSNDYFAEPVSWAVSRRITLGTGQNTFSPAATCTRAQTVTFLFRFANAQP